MINISELLDENEPPECATYDWSNWSECSAMCGQGKRYKTREFKNPAAANQAQCRTKLRDEENCNKKCGNYNDDIVRPEAQVSGPSTYHGPECAVSDWGEWSACTTSCGLGNQRRLRHYLNPRAMKTCQVSQN